MMSSERQGVICSHPLDRVEIQGNWIWDTNDGAWENGVTCFFRRRFLAKDVGEKPVLRISADSRYRAYLNGQLISRGPCRGMVDFYHYETVDLSGRLTNGENVLAVEVRWYGRRFEPRAEVHLTPGLWAMIGSEDKPGAVMTDSSWRMWRSGAHVMHAIPRNHPVSGWYNVVDPTEDVDLSKFDAGWMRPEFDDSGWQPAAVVGLAVGRYQAKSWYFVAQELVPRAIPPMEETPMAIERVQEIGTLQPSRLPEEAREIDGALSPNETTWEDVSQPLVLDGAGTHYVIVNMGKLATGYPRLTVDAPVGTMVEFRYTEALSRKFKKTIRDDPAGTVEGYHDIFTCGDGRTVVEPFIWRTFRFLRIAVHHPAGPARLERFEAIFTAYPFREQATFESSEAFHRKLWDTSWWTFRLCAHEHFEDCPYYEQIQYIYDTWLEAKVSFLVAGDFRLARQALYQFAHARRNDGIIPGRSPAVTWESVILPTLSLIWVEFLEDFYQYTGDRRIVQDLWDAVEGVLKWFEQFEHDGILDKVPYWVFTDWSLPAEGPHIAGSTGDVNMRRIGALRAAARLAKAIGRGDRAAHFTLMAENAAEGVRRRLWSEKDGLFLDEPNGRLVAEHASILSIVYDVVDASQGRQMIQRLEARNDLARMSISYAYHAFRAYEKLGLYGRAWATRLGPWKASLDVHSTTWLEMPEPSRSDCHGWGSWIMCEFLTHVLGITPGESGFASVRIAPHPLDLAWAKGSVPTVYGPVRVEWERKGDKVRCEVQLPADVTGVFVTPDGGSLSLVKGGHRTVEFDAVREDMPA